MALIPFHRGWFLEPWEEIDRIFPKWTDMRSADFSPALDMYEKKGKVVVETAIAGIDPNKVDVSIDNDVLTIKGKTEKKSEVEEEDYYRKEVRHGSFYRSVRLPAHVVGSKADASFKDGVLTIEIPKAPTAKTAKKLKVKVKGGK
ncbi:Hsp20/alpha crystallin family protein [Patescibacteria group bacterium AH-259-L07]|nr:Hsp20/alpha crystallin family protein [Patescibacteria group bacterium AH-259-L07]